jgi:hypothetical protein
MLAARMLTFFSLIKNFSQWWFVNKLRNRLRAVKRVTFILNDRFSITLLMHNFFKPWRRDDSMLGYIMGIIVKSLYIPFAGFGFLIILFFSLFFVFFEMILPILLVITLIWLPFSLI